MTTMFGRRAGASAARACVIRRIITMTAAARVHILSIKFNPFLSRHVSIELREPGCRFGVARRAPVAARGERSAGADLRRIGNGRSFELTGSEKSIEKNPQPMLDRRQIVLVSIAL